MKNVIRNHDKYATTAEVNAWLAEAREMVEKYGWQDKIVHPYSYGIKLVDMMKPYAEYADYTPSSKAIMTSEIEHLTEFFDSWEEYELQPKVEVVRLRDGQHLTVKAEIAEFAVECGKAVYV